MSWQREKEEVAEQQRRKITALNTLVPLLLLVAALGCIMWSLNFELTKQTDRRVERLGSELAQKQLLSGEMIKTYFYPDYFVAYFDADGNKIESQFGMNIDGLHGKIEEYSAKERFYYDGNTYMAGVYEIGTDNDIGAAYMVLFYNITQEQESFRWTIFDCVMIFIAFYAILIVFASLSAVYQITPYTSALKKNKQLISDISHEFNTPLAVVSATISSIMSQPQNTVEQVSDKLATAAEEVNRLKYMTKDMLLLSRSDNGRLVADLKQCNLSRLLTDTLEPFGMMAALNGKDMEFEIEPDLVVTTDPDKVRQAAIILLDNAIKYTRPGDSIRVGLGRVKDKVVFSVADTGKGVGGDLALKKIFERFYREDSARSSGGSGLGLAIVKAIAGALGGKAYAEHNIPHGLVVKLEFKG